MRIQRPKWKKVWQPRAHPSSRRLDSGLGRCKPAEPGRLPRAAPRHGALIDLVASKRRLITVGSPACESRIGHLRLVRRPNSGAHRDRPRTGSRRVDHRVGPPDPLAGRRGSPTTLAGRRSDCTGAYERSQRVGKHRRRSWSPGGGLGLIWTSLLGVALAVTIALVRVRRAHRQRQTGADSRPYGSSHHRKEPLSGWTKREAHSPESGNTPTSAPIQVQVSVVIIGLLTALLSGIVLWKVVQPPARPDGDPKLRILTLRPDLTISLVPSTDDLEIDVRYSPQPNSVRGAEIVAVVTASAEIVNITDDLLGNPPREVPDWQVAPSQVSTCPEDYCGGFTAEDIGAGSRGLKALLLQTNSKGFGRFRLTYSPPPIKYRSDVQPDPAADSFLLNEHAGFYHLYLPIERYDVAQGSRLLVRIPPGNLIWSDPHLERQSAYWTLEGPGFDAALEARTSLPGADLKARTVRALASLFTGAVFSICSNIIFMP